MGKKLSVFLIVLLCVAMATLFIEIPEVKASTTLTFTGSTSDKTIIGADVDYETARTMTSGYIEDVDEISVGQDLLVPSYQFLVKRAFVYFDTSSLPDGAVIDSAVLSLYVSYDNSDADFNVTIQNGQPTYPHDPLVAGDYYYQHYSGDGGSRNTTDGLVEGAYWNITLSAAGEGYISLTGDTKLCLRSSKDISGTSNVYDEVVWFYAADKGAGYEPKLYVEYTVPSLQMTLTSSPAIAAEIAVNGTDYVTPSYVDITSGDTAHLVAEEAKIYSGTGYLFDHYLVNGTTSYTDRIKNLVITGDTNITAYYVEIPDLYHFYGPYAEENGSLLDQNVTVTVYYDTDGYSPYSFEFNGSWVYPTSPQAQHFLFTFEDNSTREYWVDQSEDVLPVYIFWGDTTNYAINFLDTTGILQDYPYITAKRYVNGTLYTVEKRKVDVYNTVLMNLIPGRTYSIYLGNEESSYTFGDLTMTGTTSVQLVIRGVDFPKQTLLTQKTVHCYAYRNSSIFVVYEDESEATTSVLVQVFYGDFTLAYNTTETAQSFTVEWASADNETSYQVTVTVTHDTYGTLTFKQYLPADTALDTAPFGLEWLGDWTFDSSAILPALIILFVAGCFSAVNAYVGAVLMVITSIILSIMGWIPIPAGTIVAGFSLAILMALVYHKRGV